MEAYEALEVKIKSIDEKFRLLIDEAEKRNGQRFDAQQEAVATAMIAQEKAVLAAMAAAEKAVTKAESSSEKRFESVNEFRKTLSDQTNSFLTRAEFNVQHSGLSEKIETASSRINYIDKSIGEIKERGAGRSDIWGILISAISMVVSMGTLLILAFKEHI